MSVPAGLVWVKARRSAGNGQCLEVAWKTSTRSGGNGDCVEARTVDGRVYVRDSKDPDGPVLAFTPSEWYAFVGGVKDGEFDLPQG